LLARPRRWVDTAGRPFIGSKVERSPEHQRVRWAERAIELETDPAGYVEARYAPGRTADWTQYRVDTKVTGLRAQAVSASVFALVGDAAPVQVTVSSSWLRVVVGGTTIADRRLPPVDARMVSIDVSAGQVTVGVDDQPVVVTSIDPTLRGGIAFGVSGDEGGVVRFEAPTVT
jgi:hypothetical protein